jgi:hypothetical protein
MKHNYHSYNDGSDSDAIGIFEYIYVFLLVLYAGRSIVFFESPIITENPIGVFLPVAMSGLLALKRRLFFTVEFYLLLFYFLIYFVAVTIKYYEFQPTFIITYYFLFFTTYVAIKALKFNLFLMFEKIVYYLAVISLGLWGIQVLAGGDFLFNIFSRFSFLREISFVSGNGISGIIYSIQPYETVVINGATIARNCGFAWEPGSYASYLNLALFVNLFLSGNDKSKKIRFWVFILAILTTQSTTGYMLLAVIMTFYLFNRDVKKVLLLLPVAAAVLLFLFSLPFMKDKIVDLISETQTIDDIVWDSFGRENSTTPQRFTSFLMTFIDFKENPVLGLAGKSELSWIERARTSISPISGIGNLMAQLGLVGFIPFIILLLKSSFKFSGHFAYRGKILMFLVIIMISVSYTVLMIPLIMSFWMYSLFEPGAEGEPVKERMIGEAGI